MSRVMVVYSVLCGAAFVVGSAARADVAGEIARVEKLPRPKRLAEYEKLSDRKSLSAADRTAVVQAFAKHAAKVSSAFGKSAHRIDPGRWRKMLEYAHERDRGHADVAFALCQLLIDQEKFDEALPVAEAFLKAHPDEHFAKAWSEHCRRKTSDAPSEPEPLTFPLHFCVLTRNAEALTKATEEQCREEVEIFNREFVTLERKPLVKFVFKGYSAYADVKDSASDLLDWGDGAKPYGNEAVTKAFNACKDPRVRDPGAICVYVYDSHSAKAAPGDQTSHGVRNSNRPFLLIDWERLGGSLQNAEPHEMGHCFGLGHVGVPGATGQTSTNIMASAAEDFGSGGQRDLGFSESQSAVILYHARRTHSRLGLR